jgi:hypothetical protein
MMGKAPLGERVAPPALVGQGSPQPAVSVASSIRRNGTPQPYPVVL